MWVKYKFEDRFLFLNLDTISRFYRKDKEVYFEERGSDGPTPGNPSVAYAPFESEEIAEIAVNRIASYFQGTARICDISNIK